VIASVKSLFFIRQSRKRPPSSARKTAPEEEPVDLFIKLPNGKEQRMKDEAKLKVIQIANDDNYAFSNDDRQNSETSAMKVPKKMFLLIYVICFILFSHNASII